MTPDQAVRDVQEFLERMPDASLREALDTLSQNDPVLWCAYYRRLRGKPLIFNNARDLAPDVLNDLRKKHKREVDYQLDLDSRLLRHRPWLVEPLRDTHPHKVYRKARQQGVSEAAYIEEIWFLESHPNTKWIHCVPPDAEILARRGWLTYSELGVGDEVLALDHEEGVSRWEPVLEIATFPFDGMLEAVGPFHCTPEHRWPIVERRTLVAGKWYGGKRKMVTTAELRPHLHKIPRIVPHEGCGESVLSPRLASILGWVVTDGTRRMSGTAPNLNTVMMHVVQSEKKYLGEIEQLLGNKGRSMRRQVNGPPLELRGGEGSRGGEVVGRTSTGSPIYGGCYSVRVLREDVVAITAAGYRSKDDLPDLVTRLSAEAAEAMWQAMLKAEGNTSGRNRRSLFFAQLPGPVLDAFQILCTLTGRAAHLTDRGCYVATSANGRDYLKPAGWKTRRRRHRGVVWCPRTPSGTWCMRYRGKVIFTGNTFPREKNLKRFVATRVDPSFEESPRMKSLIRGRSDGGKQVNGTFLKRIRDAYLILDSAWESQLGEGVDADGVTLDERDRMNPGVEKAFMEALKASPYKRFRELSTPTLPDRGVSRTYSLSDQRVWVVKCERCGMWQEILWPDNVIQQKDFQVGSKQLPQGAYEYLCRKESCRGKLDRMFGQWVAKKPSVTNIRGYHMSHTQCIWISATALMQSKIDLVWPDVWMKYDLGLPAVGEGTLLKPMDYEMACSEHQLSEGREEWMTEVVAGIDWGHFNWIQIQARDRMSGRRYVVGLEIFEDDPHDPLEGSAKAAERYLANFMPDVIIADDGYGKDRNAYLRKRFYDSGTEFFACLDEDTKVATLDARGWKKIKDVKEGDYTYAWDGKKVVPTRVNKVWDRGMRETVEVVCRDGRGREKTITTTPDHVFIMRLGGEKRADQLQPGDRLTPFKRYDVCHGKYRVVNKTNESNAKDPSVLVYEHRWVAECLFGECPELVHHRDGCGTNNTPDNLFACLDEADHHKQHRLDSIPKKNTFSAERRKALRERNLANKEKYMLQTHTPEANAKRVATRKKRGWYKRDREDTIENHVVVRVEKAGMRHVWDLSVEHEAHNFALHDSVFVHNCRYNSTPNKAKAAAQSLQQSRQFQPVWNEAGSQVMIDRTMWIKQTCRKIKAKEVGLPSFEDPKAKLLRQHFEALRPMRDQDEDSGELVESIVSNGPDHFAHTGVYCELAFHWLEENGSFGFVT